MLNSTNIIYFIAAIGIGYCILAKSKYLLYLFVFSIPLENMPIPGQGSIAKYAFYLLLLSYVINKIYNINRESLFSPKLALRTALVIAFLMSFVTITVLYSIDIPYSIERYFLLLRLLVMVFVIQDQINDFDILHSCIIAYVLSSILVSLLAINNFIRGGMLTSALNYRASAFGTSGEEAHFAASIAPSIVYLFYNVLFIRKNGAASLLRILILVFLIVALVVSQTRSAWLGTAIAFVILLFYKAKESKSIKPVISAIVAVSVVILIISLINPAIMSIISFIITDRYQSAFESGGAGRTNIWRYGIEIFKYNYLFGSGFMSFPSAFTRYYQDVNVPGLMYGIYAGRAAHNIYLAILVETGIIGSSIALIYLVGYLYRIIKQRNKEMVYLMISMNMAMLTIGIFLDILNRKYFWFIIAITIASIKLDKQMHELSQYNENGICI